MFLALLWHLIVSAILIAVVKLLSYTSAMSSRPYVLHWLWLLVLVKLMVPAIIAVPVLKKVTSPSWFVNNLVVDPRSPFTSDLKLPSNAQPNNVTTALASLVDRTTIPDSVRDTGNHAYQSSIVHGLTPLKVKITLERSFLFVWLTVAVALLMRITVQVRSTQRLIRSIIPNEPLSRLCETIAKQLGIRKAISIGIVEQTMSPSLVGWTHPVILMPKQIYCEFDKQDITSVLLHELGHVRRGDTWITLAALMIRSCWWWNPIAWIAYRELRHSQELCCDAFSVRAGNISARTYAQSLLRVIRWLETKPSMMTPHLAAAISSNSAAFLKRRLLELVQLRSVQVSRRSKFGMTLLATILICYPTFGYLTIDAHSFQYLAHPSLTIQFQEVAPGWGDDQVEEDVLDFAPPGRVVANGHFDFGAIDHPILLAVVEPSGGTAQTVYLDLNRDRRIQLAEIATPTENKNEWSASIRPMPSNLSDKSSSDNTDKDKSAYQLIIRVVGKRIQVAQKGQLQGKLRLEGREYHAVVEDRNCNGNWTDQKDRIHVDWNNDQKLSPLRERYSCQETIVFAGQRYSPAFRHDRLELLPITGTGKLKPSIRILNETSTVDSIQAVLASDMGVHVTLDTLKEELELPVGLYRLQSLRLMLHDSRKWRIGFELLSQDKPYSIRIEKGVNSAADLIGDLNLTGTINSGSLNSSDSEAVIVQPMLMTKTNLHLVHCYVGQIEPVEDSRLVGSLIRRIGDVQTVQNLESTGFACGTFCPLKFEKKDVGSAQYFVQLEFDFGPLAGMMLTQLGKERP